jgi:hypothetical protein
MEAAKKAPSWVTRVLLPELGEMKGDIKALDTRVDSVAKSVGSLRSELKAEIRSVDTKVTEMDKRMNIRFASIAREQADRFDSLKAVIISQKEKFEFQRELAVLKAKVTELEKRK